MPDWGFPNFDGHLDPDLHDPLPESDVQQHAPTLKCRGCGAVMALGADAISYWNGWEWHTDPCYRDIVALHMQQPHLTVQELLHEHFHQVRR